MSDRKARFYLKYLFMIDYSASTMQNGALVPIIYEIHTNYEPTLTSYYIRCMQVNHELSSQCMNTYKY